MVDQRMEGVTAIVLCRLPGACCRGRSFQFTYLISLRLIDKRACCYDNAVVLSLEPLVARLEAHRIPFTLSMSGRRALFCRDPDGNAYEFMELPVS
jgi:hypothetical protein